MDSDEKQNKRRGSSCAVNNYTNNLGEKMLKQIKCVKYTDLHDICPYLLLSFSH